MVKIIENDLSAMLLENFKLRAVEPYIYSVLPNNESGNEYDSEFGYIYDLVACNPIYNRIIWGYSVKIYPQLTSEALRSSPEGNVLDLGCGSLTL